MGVSYGLAHKRDDLLLRSEILTGVIVAEHVVEGLKGICFPDTRRSYRSMTSAANIAYTLLPSTVLNTLNTLNTLATATPTPLNPYWKTL
ncbi:hypothetical protein KXD40_007351 [Peronospora effusa]|uniref:Uncharacterized protein n=1 Tax=Peronospora effusa TaxID=542832 RepID=A0A3M6V9Z2_9STRA|nr:hypothetical protein DD238_005930 [Peronospora effusa]UIZ28867.1 hypothetical protein KXD40_007351 [Peronospora effusa]